MLFDGFASLRDMPALAYGACAVLGLIIGSFLNVVIHRLPRMLHAQWALDAASWQTDAALSPPPIHPDSDLGLARPASQCPHCGHHLGLAELIPVLSWLLQRGRCRACGAPISLTYPLVELACALAFTALLWRFGLSLPALAGMLMVSFLIALALIDYQTRLLPDALTQPLVWTGLLVNTQSLMAPLEAAVIGAIAGYLSLWLVHHGFRKLTGREGMGYGDFKLLAGLGAWLGWMALPGIVLVASASGVVFGIVRILTGRQHRHEPIAFGPWLVLGGLVLLWSA